MKEVVAHVAKYKLAVVAEPMRCQDFMGPALFVALMAGYVIIEFFADGQIRHKIDKLRSFRTSHCLEQCLCILGRTPCGTGWRPASSSPATTTRCAVGACLTAGGRARSRNEWRC